jgi:hypothetical protein
MVLRDFNDTILPPGVTPPPAVVLRLVMRRGRAAQAEDQGDAR